MIRPPEKFVGGLIVSDIKLLFKKKNFFNGK